MSNAMTQNTQTGFLESQTHNPNSLRSPFDSDKKIIFIQLCHSYIDNKKHPNIDDICKTINISHRTYNYHLNDDPVFKEKMNEVKARLKELYVVNLAGKAEGKMGTLATLAMLRWLESGTWNPESRIQITSDNSVPRNAISSAPEVIDAELIDNPHLNLKNGTDNKPVT